LTQAIQTGAASALEVEVHTSFLLLLLLLVILADDDGHALAGHAGVDDEALVQAVEVDAHTAGVVDARRLTVGDRRRTVPQSTRHVPVRDRLPDVRAAASAAHAYTVARAHQRWTWFGSIHGLGSVAFSGKCDGLGWVE